jgi:hypothetical protein
MPRSLAAILMAGSSLAAAASAPATRCVDDCILVSTGYPEIRFRVDHDFVYLGRFSFQLSQKASGERFVFADTDGRTVQRLVIAQFEGFLPGVAETYNYDFTRAIQLGSHRFRSNSFAFSNAEGRATDPQAEGALTADFLTANGYAFADEWLASRFVTVPGAERKHDLILFYIEAAPLNGVTLKEIYDAAGEPTARWKKLGQELRARALRSFEVLD